jgi:hypothetical protein
MKNLALLRAILYRQKRAEEEMNTQDRRAPGATRIPLDGLVEMGGAAGPTFEAQAVNVSEEGLQVRSAYLPEIGQPLTCRFDAGAGQSVVAACEVVWSRGTERGGELGIRFVDMDPESIEALKRLCGGSAGAAASAAAGQKVRLHIDGLAAPMRAKIRDSRTSEVTVGSDLGFLQVGRQLELEDARSGTRRPASIDGVDVVVDAASHVPQLVVTLRYADVEAGGVEGACAPADGRAPAPGASRAAAPSSAAMRSADAPRADDAVPVEDASLKMKGAIAEGLGRVGPALERLASRAKMTIALLARRRRERAVADEGPRRTTAPAPGGGLHTSGRRVVRGEGGAAPDEGTTPEPKARLNRRTAAVASAVMIASVLGALAIKRSHHDGATDAAAPMPSAAAAVASVAATAAPAQSVAPPEPSPAVADPRAGLASAPSLPTGANAFDEETSSGSRSAHKRHARVAPFGNGPVHHGNVLHLQMDGAIELLEGAQQPTGFIVKVPGRKSLEAAGPLAARDSRIAVIKVSNEPSGAELNVTFRDGVPNYQVSARGDTLVIALAQVGALEKTAKKDEPGGKASKHAKSAHEQEPARETRDRQKAER